MSQTFSFDFITSIIFQYILLKLKGIGPYTAGAVGSIAFHLPVPAVDGNVLRVMSRITADPSDISLQKTKKYWEERINQPHTLECSARGDRRFSSSHVKLKINGTEKTIEEWFNSSKRNNNGKPVNKGDPFDYIIDPFTKDKLYTKEEQEDMYIGLWITYLSLNPDLVTYASKFSNFTDSKHSFRTPFKTSDIISEYVNNKDRYVNTIKSGKWYKNMKNKRNSSIDKKSSVLKERTRDSLAIEK